MIAILSNSKTIFKINKTRLNLLDLFISILNKYIFELVTFKLILFNFTSFSLLVSIIITPVFTFDLSTIFFYKVIQLLIAINEMYRYAKWLKYKIIKYTKCKKYKII